MSHKYLCPRCRVALYDQTSNKIVLTGKLRGSHFEVTGTFELNHQKDEFGGTIRDCPQVSVEKGARVDFFCPHCGFDLSPAYDQELTELIHVDEAGAEKAFFISKISGKEMSFLISKETKEVIRSYGKDKDDYMNRFVEYFHLWNKF